MNNTDYNNSFRIKPWKKAICMVLSVIIALGTFVTMTFGNILLSDWIDVKEALAAETLTPVPVFYRYGELVGIYRVNYSDTTKLQYKIGDNGTWTDYSVPFAIPAHQTTKVYARIGTSGNATYMNFSTTDQALGVYTESNTDFEFSYNGINFGYTRIYNSADKDWFESIHSKVLATNSRLEVTLPDNTKYPMIRKDANTYVDELTGKTLTKTSSNYIFNDDNYKYYFAINGVQSVAYLSAIEDYNGNKLNLSRTNNSNEISISDASGRRFYISDYYGIDAPDGSDVNYYSVKEITDPNNNKIKYTTKQGRYISVVDQAGVKLGSYKYVSDAVNYTLTKSNNKTIQYYNNGRLKQITYDNGAWIKYTYTDSAKTYTTLTSSGETTKIVYNDAFYPVEYTDEYGFTTEYTYDDHYRVLTEKTDGVTTSYSYDANGNLLSYSTNSEDNENAYYTYDSNKRLIREQFGDSYTYYTYDNKGNNLVYATLKESYKGTAPESYDSSLDCFDYTEYTYDSIGRVIKEMYSSGGSASYMYNNRGNVIKETTVTVDDDNEQTTTVVDYTYDDMGNLLTASSGDDTSSYIYDKAGRTLLSNNNGDCTRTIYDDLGRTVQEISPEDYDSTKDGLPTSNTYSDANVGQRYVYNEATGNLDREINRLDVITDYTYYPTGEKKKETFDIYEFRYNRFGSYDDIYVGGNLYAHYVYENINGEDVENDEDGAAPLASQMLNTAIEYGNGQTVLYNYDNHGNLTAQRYKASENAQTKLQYQYRYDEENTLVEKLDFVNNQIYTYTEDTTSIYVLGYDESGNAEKGKLIYSYSDTTVDDETENTSTRTHIDKVGSSTISSVYSEDKDSFTTSNGTFSITSDENDDAVTTELKNSDSETVYSSTTSYTDDTASVIITAGSTNKEYDYTYDDKGRITSYETKENGKLDPYNSEYYHYDSKGQLSRVDSNPMGGSTEVYTYDSRGNLIKVKAYPYTAGELPSNGPSDEYSIRYDDTDPWPDKLSGVQYGLDEMVYDENGNPISLDDITISWTNGRQLASFNEIDENGNEVPFLSFTYDDNGIRTSKTYGDTTTYYTNIDGNVTSQYQLDEDGNIIKLAEFIYDSSDDVIGFSYEGETYFYLKNLQNDVLGIIDSNGELIVEYECVTWGYSTGWANDDDDADIYDVNPFRYRSYIYDEEMDMCYLQSRYYITYFPRFLNADLPEYAQMQKGDTAGLNLFAYCNNDPVNNVDYNGCKSSYTIKTINLAILLDAAIIIVAPGFASSYDIIGKAIDAVLKKKGVTSAATYLLTTAIPRVKGVYSKFYTAIRTVFYRATGRAINICTSASITKFIEKVSNKLKSQTVREIISLVSMFLSVGSFIAGLTDYITNGYFKDEVKLW